MNSKQKIYLPFKRIIDIFVSFIAICLCSVFLWWWVFIINAFVTKGHPFFLQTRLGKDKKIFKIIKFRSLKTTINPNVPPYKLSISDYKKNQTKFGLFLRASSIDETPQFINVLIGNMSIVGPRPGAAINEDHLVICREKFNPCAYEVRPGITGYSQIKINRSHNPELKAKYDSDYIKKLSLGLDIKIFFTTAFAVFGISKGR